jgi:hypothetical protein
MAGAIQEDGLRKEDDTRSEENKHKQGLDAMGPRKPGQDTASEEGKNWAMEVYKGCADDVEMPKMDDEILELELELDVEEAKISMKFLAIGVFYSRKRYNSKYFFRYVECMGDPKSCCSGKTG